MKTGSTKTPVRGRGHRVSKKNRLFEDYSDEDKENQSEKVKFTLMKDFFDETGIQIITEQPIKSDDLILGILT